MAIDTSYNQAVQAYQQQANLIQRLKDSDIEDTPTTNKKASAGSFADALARTLESAAGDQYQAESMQLKALSGKAELSDLVTAVTNAELSLNTIVAVRDKVISAYQSIIAMPI